MRGSDRFDKVNTETAGLNEAEIQESNGGYRALDARIACREDRIGWWLEIERTLDLKTICNFKARKIGSLQVNIALDSIICLRPHCHARLCNIQPSEWM